MIDVFIHVIAFETDETEEIEGAYRLICPDFKIDRLFEFEMADFSKETPVLTLYKDDEPYAVLEGTLTAERLTEEYSQEKGVALGLCMSVIELYLKHQNECMRSRIPAEYGLPFVGACM